MNNLTWKNGDFCWIDLMTTDLEEAKKFYTSVFKWEWDGVETPNGPYLFSKVQDGPVGGAGLVPDKSIPPHWNAYVQVENVDEIVIKAKELGGNIIMEAFDVMDAGRMAVLSGPSGAAFSLWQTKKTDSVPRTSGMNHGMFGWVELNTNNPDADKKFYSDLFGWETKETPMTGMEGMVYTEFKNPGESYPAGGMMKILKEWGDVPPHWAIYFTVKDMNETLEDIKSNGGKIIVPAFDVPGVGTMATASDPQGGTFCLAQWSFDEKNC